MATAVLTAAAAHDDAAAQHGGEHADDGWHSGFAMVQIYSMGARKNPTAELAQVWDPVGPWQALHSEASHSHSWVDALAGVAIACGTATKTRSTAYGATTKTGACQQRRSYGVPREVKGGTISRSASGVS